MAQELDATKTAARPSHEAIEETAVQATDVADTPIEKADHIAMESAKRSQNRIHADEGKNPGTQIFTK